MNVPGVCVLEIDDVGGNGKRQHVLRAGSYVLGSSDRCDLQLRASGVSRQHLKLEVLADGGSLVEDLGSRNGTYFGKRRIGRRAVTTSERFRLGSAQITLHPDTEVIGLVALPDSTRSAGEASERLSLSQVTDLPDRAWMLLQDADALLSLPEDGTRDGDAVATVSALLARWLTRLDARCLRLSRRGDPDRVIAAVGEAGEEASRRRRIEVGGCVLEIEWTEADAAPGGQKELALRIGLAAICGRLETTAAALDPAPISGGAVERRAETAADAQSVTASAALRALYELTGRVARGDVSVLIRGESGVGKELLASWIHRHSPRRDGPFLAINCAALPADLLEAELFGIERGVATGVEAREGLLERARGGTLFLDEIGDMEPSIQAKVLRALESDSVYRVGGSRPIGLDVRFLAATHQNMEKQLDDGRFRLDLFHRIAAVELPIPPLRERREDIANLAIRFLAEELSRLGRPAPGITVTALAALCAYDWLGNVRELRNEMARAALLLDAHQPLGCEQLSPRICGDPAVTGNLSLESALRRAEREAFDLAQSLSGGDHAAAMELLELPRSSYFRRLRQIRGVVEEEAERRLR